jgi:hypothetical protein
MQHSGGYGTINATGKTNDNFFHIFPSLWGLIVATKRFFI